MEGKNCTRQVSILPATCSSDWNPALGPPRYSPCMSPPRSLSRVYAAQCPDTAQTTVRKKGKPFTRGIVHPSRHCPSTGPGCALQRDQVPCKGSARRSYLGNHCSTCKVFPQAQTQRRREKSQRKEKANEHFSHARGLAARTCGTTGKC